MCGCRIDGVEDDVVEVWPIGRHFMPTAEIVDALQSGFPSKWGACSCYERGLTAQRLGRYLSHQMGIYSKKNSKDKRGYCMCDFGGSHGNP